MRNRRLDDKLVGKRELSSTARPWKGLALVAAAAVIIGGGYAFFAGEPADEQPAVDPAVQAALQTAGGAVADGMDSWAEMVDSGRVEAIVDERRLARAEQADWTEGEEMLIAGEIEPDESVYVAMVRRQIPEASVHRAVTEMEEEFDFRRVSPGDKWRAKVDGDGYVQKFRYQTSPEDIWVARRDGDEFGVKKQDIDLDIRQRTMSGQVVDSFWLTMSRQGHSDLLALRFMEVFQYTIDFNTETRDGDHFAMVYEEVYLDDELLRHGRVLAAAYVGERGAWEGYWYETDDESGYYDKDGESLQRMFLRSPLDVTRVTSGFGRRTHPITGDERMHQGVDYGAPTGTPVQATADGTVTFAGWSGGYGNLLKIRHSGGYETRYAHLSSFGSGISPGTRVRQGQIVARSGNTGASTAPHLHYEMLRHGQHINPLGVVDETSGEPLEGEDLSEFQAGVLEEYSAQLRETLGETSSEAVASLEADDDE